MPSISRWIDHQTFRRHGVRRGSGRLLLLLLAPWGDWERNIQEVLERGVARRANVTHIKEQLAILASPILHHHDSWFAKAQQNALDLPPLF